MERVTQKRLRTDMVAGGKSDKHAKAYTRAVNIEERNKDIQDLQGCKPQEEDGESAVDLWWVEWSVQGGEAAQVAQAE